MYAVSIYFTVVSGSGGANMNYFMYRKLCHVVFPKWFPKQRLGPPTKGHKINLRGCEMINVMESK